MLEIKNLSVSLGDKQLLRDINMHVAHRARHWLAGHNGSGKSTLLNTIAGAPEYTIDQGQIIFDGAPVTDENITNRALRGIFLGAQHVPEIAGLSVMSFLKHSAIAHTHFNTGRDLSMGEFLEKLEHAREQLSIPREWMNRSINVGFSGGERKRIMLLRLILTAPKLAILDEPDAGADEALQQQIADTIHNMPNTTFLFTSHQSHFKNLISPTAITTLSDGHIVIE